jgi:predicted porin
MFDQGTKFGVSSNLTYFGVRARHNLEPYGYAGWAAIAQFESLVEVAAVPTERAAFGTRDSFIGMESPWGTIKAGKADTPYKRATAKFDPFSATLGDYNSIMGNTGGDNRAEFDTRQPHTIWYESPNLGGAHLNVAFSPGQNRNPGNVGSAQGESNCPGGHLAPPATSNVDPAATGPLAGSADTPLCEDGAFNNVFSAAGLYSVGPLYAIAAYELHTKVNRISDETAPGAGTLFPTAAPGSLVGIRDERAWKVGAQYTLAATTINAIYENMHRDAPMAQFNERQRWGTWLAVTQKFGSEDLNVGWAHAGKTPGDPLMVTAPDNSSNMYALGWKHHFADKKTTFYAVAATQRNHKDAHFDLGASGHGATIDCHDNTLPSQVCYPGNIIKAVSIGMTYDF